MYVHRKFADPPITFAVPVRSRSSPADDFVIDVRHDGGITTSNGLQRRLLIPRRSKRGFIGGDAVFNALIVNFSNGRGVFYGGGPNVDAVHVWTFVCAITLVQLRRLLHRSLARTLAAPRATPAWRTSPAAGISERPALRVDHPMSSALRSCRLSPDREMLGAFPLLPPGFCPSISLSSVTPKPG